MSFQAVCPDCRASYTLVDEQLGKKVRCKKCQNAFVAEPPPPPERARSVRTERPAPRPRPAAIKTAPPRSAGRVGQEPARRNNVPWIVGGAVACTLVLAGTAVFLATRPKEKDKPEPDPVAVAPRNPAPQPATLPGVQLADTGGVNVHPPATLPDPNLQVKPDVGTKPTATEPPPTPADAPIAKGKLTAEARDKVKRATVYVRVTLPDGRKASGTGFFGVASEANLVVTNAHVVGMLAPRARRPRLVEVMINSGQGDEKRAVATVLGVDRGSDLALLKIEPMAGLPAPLGVKSANGLGELDEVYVFGFPLGENLGKEITIRPSSVSSLRKKDGVLDRVQVNGGMDPGNSGGPVVDAAGDVVGVAVSGIPGRQINFAIPADRVGGMLNGRIAELGMGQTYRTATGVGVPMTMVMIDPRGRVRQPAIDVWVGDKGSGKRPPAKMKPADAIGDTPHKRVVLKDYDRVTGVAHGDVDLPELPAGKEYWMQPVWVNATGQEQWAGANSFKLPNVPVERRPALLVARQQNGRRTLTLTTKTTLRPDSGYDEKDSIVLSTEAKMSEQVANASNQGADVALRYLSLSQTQSVPGGETKPRKLLEQVLPYKDRMLGVLRVDAFGKLVQNEVVFQGVPEEIAGALKRIHAPTQKGLDAMTIVMPNKEVQPGDHWKGRTSLLFDQPGHFEAGEMDVTYTYLGRRRNNGRDEAVVSLDGVVRQERGSEVDLGGNASGTAVIDEQTGRVTSAHTSVTVELEAVVSEEGEKQEKLQLLATLEVRLERKW